MALTSEQIYNLKEGDEIIVHGTYDTSYSDGDIRVNVCWTVLGEKCDNSFLVHSSLVSLPSEYKTSVPTTKYNPCRLFRKGDWVRIVKHQGRKFNAAPPAFQLGKTYRVSEDENTEHCYVMLQSCDLHYAHPVAFLELVTPVEASEPYYVERQGEKSGGLCYTVSKQGGYTEATFYFGKCRSRDEQQAKAAAETECDRLNKEWKAKACRSDEGKEGQ